MIGAYTISLRPVKWKLKTHWLNYVDDNPISKYKDTHAYINYLAQKRNRAVESLLKKYPETTDILCCDSSYVDQTEPLSRLIYDYTYLKPHLGIILGGAPYGPWRQRAKDIFHTKTVFSDPWGVPELAWTQPGERGFAKTRSVTGIHIFPRNLWEKGARYGVYDDVNKGTETTFFTRESGADTYIDLDAWFYRPRLYSRLKCLRVSLGLRTRFRGGVVK